MVVVSTFGLDGGHAARKNVDFAKGMTPRTNLVSPNPWCPARNAVEVVSHTPLPIQALYSKTANRPSELYGIRRSQ